VRPSAAEKVGSEVSPDYDITQHAHAPNKPRINNESDFK
jgi:hypothetical protein